MKNTHTPTPWAVSSIAAKATYIRGTKPHICAEAFGPSVAEAEANASYIVHCVNTHAELVAALERLIPTADHLSGFGNETNIHIEDIEFAKATLSRAKEGQP